MFAGLVNPVALHGAAMDEGRGLGRASLAALLLIALVTGLGLGWSWFRANRDTVVDRAGRLWQRFTNRPALRRLSARYPRASAFITARLARGEYLGLHLTIGLLSSVAALWLFAGVTEDVISRHRLTGFDFALTNWFRVRATPSGYAFFRAVSRLGSPSVMASMALAVALILAVRRQWLVLGAWSAGILGGEVLNAALKLVIRRPRPLFAATQLHDWSFSFPSGHAMEALIGYGMLAYLIAVRIERRSVQIAAVATAALLILAIGFSRLYLGVHYFSDVVGGYAAGTVWLSACLSGLEVARRTRANHPPAQPPSA